ncbi:MAG: AAA family ATPase, partial [Tepidisphaeraceae bacterium]
MDLFKESRQKNLARVAPLPIRMRPRSLDEFVGQQHFLAPGKLLRRMLEADRLTSVIFYGPPGTGKTTLAQLIAIYT